MSISLSFEQIISIIGLIVNVVQALVLPITIYLLVVQTRAMREQTTALLVQSKEMTEQTRVFTDTIYSATFQSLYDAEAHIGELMMTYPDESRILIGKASQDAEEEKSLTDIKIGSEQRERVSWLGTAMLDFFEHVWTQAQKNCLPEDTWESWEEYMRMMISKTRLRLVWKAEREYYSPGFRHFVDHKIGLSPDMPPVSRSQPEKVARVIRAVTEEPKSL